MTELNVVEMLVIVKSLSLCFDIFKGMMSKEEDEGCVSNGGADDKQPNEESEVKEDKLDESSRPESSAKIVKKSFACKIMSCTCI